MNPGCDKCERPAVHGVSCGTCHAKVYRRCADCGGRRAAMRQLSSHWTFNAPRCPRGVIGLDGVIDDDARATEAELHAAHDEIDRRKRETDDILKERRDRRERVAAERRSLGVAGEDVLRAFDDLQVAIDEGRIPEASS